MTTRNPVTTIPIDTNPKSAGANSRANTTETKTRIDSSAIWPALVQRTPEKTAAALNDSSRELSPGSVFCDLVFISMT